MPFKVHATTYEFPFYRGVEEFKDIFGCRRRRGVYIKIEDLETKKFGIGEVPVPFFGAKEQSEAQEQEEIRLVKTLCTAISLESNSFRFMPRSEDRRLFVYSMKRTEQWVDLVCSRLRNCSMALRSALVEAVLCACLVLIHKNDFKDPDIPPAKMLRFRYEDYFAGALPKGIKQPEFPIYVSCEPLVAKDWVQSDDNKLEKSEDSKLDRSEDSKLDKRQDSKQLDKRQDSRQLDKRIGELVPTTTTDLVGEWEKLYMSVRDEKMSAIEPSLFTTDFSTSVSTYDASIRSTWETGVGLAHLALTAAYAGPRAIHNIHCFPRRYDFTDKKRGDFAHRITAQFAIDCYCPVWTLAEKEVDLGGQKGKAVLGAQIRIEMCEHLLMNCDPFAALEADK